MIQTILLRLTGIILIIIPLIPLTYLFSSKDRKPNLSHLNYISPEFWLILILIFIGCSVLLGIIFNKLNQHTYLPRNHINKKYFLLVSFAILFCELLFISFYSFNFQPGLVDSIAQLFQAKIFASGRLVAQHPENLEFFTNHNFVYHQGNWSAQYPPGHALVLSIGELFHCKAIIPILLSLLSAYFIYQISNLLYGNKIAKISLLLILLCPFFLFMGSSYMNHVTTLFALSGFYCFILRWDKLKKNRYLIISAIFLGLAFITRPYATFLAAIPAIPMFLKNSHHRKEVSSILCSTFIFSLFIVFWLFFNKASTGEYFLTGYTKTWGDLHGLGFHETPWGTNFTFKDGLLNQLLNLTALNSDLFNTLLPSTYPIAILFLLSNKISNSDKLLLSIIILLFIGHIFYWHTDFYLGARFLYSSLIAFIPLTAKSLLLIFKKLSAYKLKTYAISSLIVLIIFYSFVNFPDRLTKLHQSYFRNKIYDNLNSKLIFVKTSWASRVDSKLLGMGISANLKEKAFKKIGLCKLSSLANSNYSKDDIEIKIKELINANLKTTRIAIKKTPPARFNLPLNFDNCENEINYDIANNHTSYGYYFLGNDPVISQKSKIIIAKDLGADNQILINKFPNHTPLLLTKNGLRDYPIQK